MHERDRRRRSPERSTSAVVEQPERPKLFQILGPGLITGASDDDPSGIATYSQAGAQYWEQTRKALQA